MGERILGPLVGKGHSGKGTGNVWMREKRAMEGQHSATSQAVTAPTPGGGVASHGGAEVGQLLVCAP